MTKKHGFSLTQRILGQAFGQRSTSRNRAVNIHAISVNDLLLGLIQQCQIEVLGRQDFSDNAMNFCKQFLQRFCQYRRLCDFSQ